MNSCDKEMPRYQSIKKVWGLKIKSLVKLPDGTANFFPEEKGYGSILLNKSYMEKHNPEIGGYYVVDKDGYKSFCPAESFEKGNILIDDKYKTDLNIKNLSEDYQKRVCIEYNELREKINKLTLYLSKNSDELLVAQLRYMCGYADILSERAKEFK